MTRGARAIPTSAAPGGGVRSSRRPVGRRPPAPRGLVALAVAAALVASGFVASAAARPPAPAPQRIVSVVPSLTETLFAIGAGPRVIAVSSFDRYPPQVSSLPKVGALLDPDVERIIALRPDLVIVYASQTDLIAELSRARVPVFSYAHAALGDVTSAMRALGARVGEAESAARVA